MSMQGMRTVGHPCIGQQYIPPSESSRSCWTPVLIPGREIGMAMNRLHDVAWSDNPGVIKALVEAGADPEVRNENDATPLHVAAAYSDIPAIVTALLEAGADLEARDERGWTPLHLAAAYNEVPSVVEALLYAGAGLETKSEEWGLTPLHFAAWKSETPDVIATLAGCRCQSHCQDQFRRHAMGFCTEQRGPAGN